MTTITSLPLDIIRLILENESISIEDAMCFIFTALYDNKDKSFTMFQELLQDKLLLRKKFLKRYSSFRFLSLFKHFFSNITSKLFNFLLSSLVIKHTFVIRSVPF